MGEDDELGEGGDELDDSFVVLGCSAITGSPSTKKDDGESRSIQCWASRWHRIVAISGQTCVHNLQCFSDAVDPMCSFWKCAFRAMWR